MYGPWVRVPAESQQIRVYPGFFIEVCGREVYPAEKREVPAESQQIRVYPGFFIEVCGREVYPAE